MMRAMVAALCLLSSAVAEESRWKGLEFLFGNWVAAGTGRPGAGSGQFGFHPDLRGNLLMRLSRNDLENGTRHEDLMVIYFDGATGPIRAMYWDTEGHVIRYKVSTPEVGRAVFDSEGEGPQYRLSYWMAGPELKGKFEVGGKTYLEWTSKKMEGGK